jgi:hypothetical protein
VLEALAGSLFLLKAPLAVAALVGVAVATCRSARGPVLALLAAAGAIAAFWLPAEVAIAAPLVTTVLGAVAASAWRPPAAVAGLLAMSGGLGAGLAADFHWASPAEVAGGVLAAGMLTGVLLALLQEVERRPARHGRLLLALRIVGAWVLVLGVLMLLVKAFPRA